MNRGAMLVVELIMVAVLMIVFPIVMDATHDLQVESQTDTDLALSGTPPAGTCTLTVDLWNADTDSVLSAIDDQDNVLTMTSYNETTRVLTVGNVHTSATTATIIYEVDGLTEFTGMGALVGITPLLIWIAILAAVLGGIWFTVKGYMNR